MPRPPSRPEPDSAGVSITVPERGRSLIESAVSLMQAGEDPATALLRAVGSQRQAEAPSRRPPVQDDDQARLRDERNMTLLRSRLEASELQAAAVLGRHLQQLKGWRRMLVRFAGIDA